MNPKQFAIAVMLETTAELAACIGIRRGWTIERTQQWVRDMGLAAHLAMLVLGDHPLAVVAEIIVRDRLDQLVQDKMVIDVEFVVFEVIILDLVG